MSYHLKGSSFFVPEDYIGKGFTGGKEFPSWNHLGFKYV